MHLTQGETSLSPFVHPQLFQGVVVTLDIPLAPMILLISVEEFTSYSSCTWVSFLWLL